MDPHGGIHSMVKALDGSDERDVLPPGNHPPARVDAEAIRKKLGPMVPIPDEMLEALQQSTRAVRRGWYAEYRHRLKVAKKTGRPATPPPIPAPGASR